MEEEFKKYVSKFPKDKNIVKKYNHSLRVKEKSKKISRDLNLNENEIYLSSLIGLLHDFGRFYQWEKYKTFNDKKSIDHAFYGAQLLFEKGYIERFYDKKEDYKIIKDAIKYHNKYELKDDVEDIVQCQIIRDSDKLDLLDMFTTGEFEFKEKGMISEKVKKDFNSHKLIKHEDKNTDSDQMIGVLSFVFDLYLMPSFKYLKENRVLDKIYEKVKDKEKFEPFFKEADKYIERKLEYVR